MATSNGPVALTGGAHAVGDITGALAAKVDTTNVRCGSSDSDQYTVYLSDTRRIRLNRAVNGYPLGVWVDDLPKANYVLIPGSGKTEIKPDKAGADVDVDLEPLSGTGRGVHVRVTVTC